MMFSSRLGFVLLSLLLAADPGDARRREDKTRCPHVRAIRNFDLQELLGRWYVVQYYASSEEALDYRCMRALFSVSADRPEVSMNFTYSFTDDPQAERLFGNITWEIPDPTRPAHWVHAEDSYEGVYNTYVLDSDYVSWALLLHCAEKNLSPRYLSSFIMSRTPSLDANVATYLRDKLPRYDVDLQFVFPMNQTHCSETLTATVGLTPTALASVTRKKSRRRHPLKTVH